MAETELAARWNDLTAFVRSGVREHWWTRVLNAYRTRPVYNLDHLQHIFRLYDLYKDCLHDRYACGIAIFFLHLHYDPKCSNNEEKNVELLKEFSNETTFDSTNYVAELITASCSEANWKEGNFGGEDSHYLGDFELSLLASSPDVYRNHCQAIRKDYEHLDDHAFAEHRLKVLKAFLQIPNIYATKEMREKYEQVARQNIQREIEELTAMLHVG